MREAWTDIFDNHGIKVVTETDKNKAAYVLNEDQLQAVLAAELRPSDERPTPPITMTVLFDPHRSVVTSGFYYSRRSKTAHRSPEPRMGKEFISSWLEVGDEVLIGNIGHQLFSFKITKVIRPNEAVKLKIARRVNRKTIIARAKKATGKPLKVKTERVEFVRNQFVIAAALLRAESHCEMPACTHALFFKDDGEVYLEVHHIDPLAEGGHDILLNVAALCPHCHRELHFGSRRKILRSKLKLHIAKIHIK